MNFVSKLVAEGNDDDSYFGPTNPTSSITNYYETIPRNFWVSAKKWLENWLLIRKISTLVHYSLPSRTFHLKFQGTRSSEICTLFKPFRSSLSVHSLLSNSLSILPSFLVMSLSLVLAVLAILEKLRLLSTPFFLSSCSRHSLYSSYSECNEYSIYKK